MKKTNLLILFVFIINVSFSQINSQEKFEIYFKNNSAFIDKNSESLILNKLSVDTNSKIISVIIEAHCDSKGSTILNDTLSKDRAYAVFQLISNHIEQAMITQHYYGKNKIKYPYEKDSLNRRAEITINIERNTPKIKQNEITQKTPTETKPINTDDNSVNNSQRIIEAEVGELIVFESIQFYPGQAVPLPKSLDVMQDIANILLENPNIEIEIQGHICCTATDDDNISTKRAKCVYDYLIENGIRKERLTYKGYGRTRPRTDESTPELTQMNRRVEIKITKK